MSRTLLFVLLLATGVALADEAPAAKRAQGDSEAQDEEKQDKEKKEKEDPSLGMSILGNQEAPKALVIVPWKRSEIGDSLGFSTLLDDSRQPIDREVFMRMLNYYNIRSETAGHGGAPAATAPRRKS